MISQTATYIRNPDQIFSSIDGEIVMLNLENSEYYSFDIVSSYVWQILSQPTSFNDIIIRLMDEFEVEKNVCIKDTEILIFELLKKGLILSINIDSQNEK